MTVHHDRASDSFALPPEASTPDPLSGVLRTVRLTGALFFQWDVSWPYATPVPDGSSFASIILPGAQQIVSYHVVTDGSAWAGLPGGEPVPLLAGDVLLVPHGHAYAMASTAAACRSATVELAHSLEFFRQMAAGELPFVVEQGGGGPGRTRVICGFLGCDDRPFNPLLDALPPLVRVRAPAEPARDRLQPLLELALAESREPRPGSHTMLLRLSELLFVEVVRRCAAELPDGDSSWLSALRDPIVGCALSLLHKSPTAPWTVESLAATAGISRSQLAERFTRCVGEPPMQYLARWRIQLATRLLAESSTKVAAIAHEVGYASEAAFSRAFKRHVKLSPAAWRARLRDPR